MYEKIGSNDKFLFGDISDDEAKNLEDEVQKLTDKYIAQIDKAIEEKSTEILTV